MSTSDTDLKYSALVNAITKVVNSFIANEEDYDGDVQLAIDPANLTAEIADPDDDLPTLDYYPMMDMVRADADGRWLPDTEAIADIAADYLA